MYVSLLLNKRCKEKLVHYLYSQLFPQSSGEIYVVYNKIFLAISFARVDLKISVSEIFVSIIRIDVMNDHMSLLCITVCEIGASSSWCTMQQGDRVKLCDHLSALAYIFAVKASNLS
jgi:hypothetical protein